MIEQLNNILDIGILAIVLANAFFLLKNSRKLKQLGERLNILAAIKVK